MSALHKAADRRQWKIAELVNSQWATSPKELLDEISVEDFYVECSYWINQATGFPLVSASGETLRKWCNDYAAFEGMPGFEEMREVLAYEYFHQARILANNGKVSVPSYALAYAIENKLTADEMRQHFDPPTPPDWYQQANDKLDWFLNYAREHANGAGKQIAFHVGEIRKLLGGGV